MRRFHSYGPVDCKYHFCVHRKKLIEKCKDQLIGISEEGGHFFTIWAPRQTGKTWLLRQSIEEMKKLYGGRFVIGDISMQGIAIEKDDNPNIIFFKRWQTVIRNEFKINVGEIESWEKWMSLFEKDSGIFEKPLILIIDEFDKLPKEVIDTIVSMFRDMYLTRKNYMLHGLALVGVRAVLGVDSDKGSPFNIQRSIHIPNLTYEEVSEMFNQYQDESGQSIDTDVVDKIYEVTNGQPGLVGWFGELLTEKYNEDPTKKIDMDLWEEVYACSRAIEHNNTVLNIISKARNEYKEYVYRLFANSDVDFSFKTDWCNYMYMHGLISYDRIKERRQIRYVCRFSSPFIQICLYDAFIGEIKEIHDYSVLAIEPLDILEDVFEANSLNLPALLERYKAYLKRLHDKGINPWKNQPRRKSDLHLTEAVGHFHLYHWLQMALDNRCAIMPEFPTGNGKVDLHLLCDDDDIKGLIEVKSFVSTYQVQKAMKQAAEYAKSTKHKEVTVVMFAPFPDEDILKQISRKENIDGVEVHVVAIGQG